jgi:hypothetical protein
MKTLHIASVPELYTNLSANRLRKLKVKEFKYPFQSSLHRCSNLIISENIRKLYK